VIGDHGSNPSRCTVKYNHVRWLGGSVGLATGDRGSSPSPLHSRERPWTSCSHTLSSASEFTTLWRYINQFKFFFKSSVRQTKLASSLVNFRAHYKIVWLYFLLSHTLPLSESSISLYFLGGKRTHSATHWPVSMFGWCLAEGHRIGDTNCQVAWERLF